MARSVRGATSTFLFWNRGATDLRVLTEQSIHLSPKALPEGFAAEAFCVHRDTVRREALEICFGQSLGERGKIVFRNEHPCLTVHNLRGPSFSEPDHRSAGGLRLDCGNAELLDTGNDQRLRLRVQVL